MIKVNLLALKPLLTSNAADSEDSHFRWVSALSFDLLEICYFFFNLFSNDGEGKVLASAIVLASIAILSRI